MKWDFKSNLFLNLFGHLSKKGF